MTTVIAVDYTQAEAPLQNGYFRDLSWALAIGELVDNSLDAGATSIVVTIGDGELTIKDNGRGTLDLEKFFVRGEREDHETTASGRYGIGAKESLGWLHREPEVYIESHRDGRRARVHFNRRECRRDGRHWLGPDLEIDDAPGVESGTYIRAACQRPLSDIFRLSSDIRRMFTPAVQRGADIRLRLGSSGHLEVLRPLKPPALQPESVVAGEFYINLYPVRYRAGLVADGEHGGGVNLLHAFRIINFKMPSSIGLGGCPISPVWAEVLLPREAELTQNKGSLTDDWQAVLQENLEICFAPLRDRLGQLPRYFDSVQIGQHFLNRMIPGNEDAVEQMKAKVKKRIKEKRPGEKGVCCGTVKPAGSGRTRANAANADEREPGSVEEPVERKSGIVVRAEDLNNTDTIGEWDADGKAVTLNTSHPSIAKIVSAEKACRRADSIEAIAYRTAIATILVEAHRQRDGRALLQVPDGASANEMVGILLKR
jgi:hypothetical protein